MQVKEYSIIQAFKNAGQAHVFEGYDSLSVSQKAVLRDQAAQIDLSLLHALADKFLPISKPTPHAHMGHISPPHAIRLPQYGGDPLKWEEAFALGEHFITEGKLAILTVAGGHGTRLGTSAPKGTIPVTPIKQKSLFQVFAEKIVAAQNKYGATIHWFVMTSGSNHEATVDFFNQHNCFGLDSQTIHFFKQGQMPAINFQGKIIMESPASISMSPDGHGGSFYALKNNGLLDFMQKNGIELLSYHQVDNPLARIIDPAFIGFHISGSSDFSSKMVPKTLPEEKVGLFCSINNRLNIIEYSDFPRELAHQMDSNGQLRFNAANVAIHLVNVAFVGKVTEKEGLLESLPFHRAIKAISFLKNNQHYKPTEPNGIRFERFIFDALPLANNPILIETQRAEEFSPVKNASGPDSLETCARDQQALFRSWLAKVVPNASLSNLEKIEISPLFADSEKEFIKHWNTAPQNILPETKNLFIE